MTSNVIDFKLAAALRKADQLQRIALSGPEAAEVQRLMKTGWVKKEAERA